MQVEAALGRVGLWFAVLVLAIVAAATAVDSGFAAHAWIVATVSFVLMWMSASRFDPVGKAQGFFRMPEGPSRYDDDVVRWGVLATTFWGLAGLLAAHAEDLAAIKREHEQALLSADARRQGLDDEATEVANVSKAFRGKHGAVVAGVSQNEPTGQGDSTPLPAGQ